MPSINTAYFAMLLQIYKSIFEKQKSTEEFLLWQGGRDSEFREFKENRDSKDNRDNKDSRDNK